MEKELGALENLTFEEFSNLDEEIDKAAESARKKIRTATIGVMIFDVINFVIAILWIISIAFAWRLQPGSIGTFMMQFLYLPYVLVIHTFFGELRRMLDKLNRRIVPQPLVTYQTIMYYLGVGFIINSAMFTVTILRFESRIVEDDRLYWSAVALSFVIDFMSIIQFLWIAYTLFSFIRTWRKVKSTKDYLDPSNAFRMFANGSNDFFNTLFWNTNEKVGNEIPRKIQRIKYEF